LTAIMRRRRSARQSAIVNVAVLAPPPVSVDLLRRLDVPGPRYTSYPTADRFTPDFGAADYRRALSGRARPGAAQAQGALSVYVHVPFCESVCYYCACNKVVTRRHDRAAPYLEALETEIALHAAALGDRQAVTQLHFGGGTPTFLSDEELGRVMASLGSAFRILRTAEVSIEVDPRTADPDRLARLRAMGFNRLSLGVQDFDPGVQEAVHRVQSYESVESLLGAARALGFESTNVDLIYGLPKQSAASFARTLAQVRALRPDRIALYAYAHLPDRFKPQRRIDPAALPAAQDKVAMLQQAIAAFTGEGYVYIGMDHFALPDDTLAVARREGRLHRNFQGYSTQPDCDVIGLGVSAIGRVGATYSQNAKTLEAYYDALANGEFPVERGYPLGADDVLRRDVIMALMCQGRVAFKAIERAHAIDFRSTFAQELDALDSLAELGLVTVGRDAVEVTALGWHFVRRVAMLFDRHLRANLERERFSRVV
jgi:oxygen-independent coproporphyrinogen-3 oxidase